ncbi:MAG TPA: hypothetical protein VK254_00010 [Candidatus Bathyarchaeia archaeon]|nr:hypothetical protein [Candidatus Bathyarchaeia archaeon]
MDMENPGKIVDFSDKKKIKTEADIARIKKFLQETAPSTEELNIQKKEQDTDYIQELRRARPDLKVVEKSQK